MFLGESFAESAASASAAVVFLIQKIAAIFAADLEWAVN